MGSIKAVLAISVDHPSLEVYDISHTEIDINPVDGGRLTLEFQTPAGKHSLAVDIDEFVKLVLSKHPQKRLKKPRNGNG